MPKPRPRKDHGEAGPSGGDWRVSASTPRWIRNDRVGGARNDDRKAGKGTASPEFRSRARNATTKTAVEMPSLWKPKSGFHRDLEISHRTRDSHIPTSRSFILFLRKEKTTNEDPGATADQPEDLNDLDLRICLDNWVHFSLQGELPHPPRLRLWGSPDRCAA